METEILTCDNVLPVKITWDTSEKYLKTKCADEIIGYTQAEAIQLRNFLNQLNLEEK